MNKPKIRFKGFNDDWEQRKLSEMCGTFEYGLNAAAKEFDGKNKYLRITDIEDDSREFLLTDVSSPDICLDGMSKYLLSSGDIVFARTGASVGKTYIYKENDGIVYFAGFLIRAKVKQENNAEFVFQSTLTPSYEKYIRITSQRSGQPGVNAQEYGEYNLFVPSKEEQQKIGQLLRNLDNLITLHQWKCLIYVKIEIYDKNHRKLIKIVIIFEFILVFIFAFMLIHIRMLYFSIRYILLRFTGVINVIMVVKIIVLIVIIGDDVYGRIRIDN